MGDSVAAPQPAPPQRAGAQRAPAHATFEQDVGIGPSISRLQRAAGNRGLTRLLRSRVIQPKLTVGRPDDEFEREADRVADEVMRMPDPRSASTVQRTPLAVQRKCAECEKEDELHRKPALSLARAPLQISRMCPTCAGREHDDAGGTQAKTAEPEEDEEGDGVVQAKSIDADPPEVPNDIASQLTNRHHDGAPLPEPLRDFFEPRLDADLGGVRLHAGARDAEMADALNARAFTLGPDIFFGAGQYAPSTDQGRHLIAHELAHTLQQSGVAPLETPSASYSFVVPILSLAPLPLIQRRANIAFAPPGLACILVDVHGTPGELDILFDKDQALLSAANLALIENFVGLWVGKGLSPDLTISGYASTEGTQQHNWALSCQRAEAVQGELVRLGVPADKTTVFAHGETNDFDAANLEPNRRATIDSTPGTGPTITPILTPSDNFAGRSTTRYGLSETLFVDYTATPSIAAAEHFGVQWAVVAGTGTVVNLPLSLPALYQAGNVPAVEQLALVVTNGPGAGTQLVVQNVNVIAPLSSYMVQVPGTGLCHTNGTASVGFRGNPFMLPTDVSFNGIRWREGTGTTVASGSLSGLNGNVHPIGTWMRIGNGNITTGCRVRSVDSVSTSTSRRLPFIGRTGMQIWPIQWEYQAPGGSIQPLVIAYHVCTINSAGLATISKAGAGPFSRVVADPTSCVAVAGLPPHCC